MRKVDLEYKLLHFPKVDKWVAVAWNYGEAILVTSVPCATYTKAKNVLGDHPLFKSNTLVREGETLYNLRWFDGEYELADNGFLLPKRGE